MRKTIVSALMFTTLAGGLAIAGKPERDKQAELAPQVKNAMKDVKDACGCAVAIDVKWASYPTASDMNRVADAVGGVATAAKNQCTTPENKKALCSNLKSVEVSFGKSTDSPPLASKTIKLQSSDVSYNDDGQLKQIFDKF